MRTILAVLVASALAVPAVAGTANVRDVLVYNDQNQKLGEVREVLVTPDGNVRAAIVKVEGGEGDLSVAVPIEQVKVANNKIIIAMSRDQLMAQPPLHD
jgi:hypothetical protein